MYGQSCQDASSLVNNLSKFRLLSGDHACIFAFDKYVSTCTCEYVHVCMVKIVKMLHL